MKAEIHPNYHEVTVTCACGNSFKTLSNKESHFVETCSSCSPAYTGKTGTAKKTGTVEKFNKKYNLN